MDPLNPSLSHYPFKAVETDKPLSPVAQSAQANLERELPTGAGSIAMILEDGSSEVVSAGVTGNNGTKLDGQTAAMIGSGTKLFTGLCALALVKEGILDLDAPIAEVLKDEMHIFDNEDKAKELTLRMLLSHTGGLIYFADDNRTDRTEKSLEKILQQKKSGSVKFFGTPGDKIYSYSNHIGLVSAMIEKATGKPYAKVLKETVLSPLGMERTSYQCPEDDNVLLTYPASEKSELKDAMIQGASGLWSCMDDMTKLAKAFTEGGLKSIISEELFDEMKTNQTINANIGLGVEIEDNVIGKGGNINGYDFKFKVNLANGTAVSTMCNREYAGYKETVPAALQELDPSIQSPPTTSPKAVSFEDLKPNEIATVYKGFSGYLGLPDEEPLTRMSYNGTTLPLEKRGDNYLVVGDSEFQGRELRFHGSYPCLAIPGTNEVWSFAKVEQKITSASNLQEAAGVYHNPKANGPPTFHVAVTADGELELFYPVKPHRKCLVIAANEKVVDFAAWTEDGPQPVSFRLIRSDPWQLQVLNGETNDFVAEYPQSK